MQGRAGTSWVATSLVLVLLLWNMTSVVGPNGMTQGSTESVTELERRELFIGGAFHAPIIINGDANFNATVLAEGWPGDGSHGNPYIIESLDIDRVGLSGDCINISNTRVHFIVRNCFLTGANVSAGSGLHLTNVSNGEVTSNLCTNNTLGIYLDQSSSNTVANNTYNSNRYSIVLISSNNNMVTNNTCTNNDDGILFSSSSSNTVINNTCTNSNDYGISLGSSCSNNVVANNTCSSNNVGISLGSSCSNNMVANNTCSGNNYGIRLESCSNNVVADNTCSGNSLYGIHLLLSHYNTLVNNTCSNNTQYGIFIEATYFNAVINNTCSNNQFGVWLFSCGNSTVANNICTNNYDSGIHLRNNADNNTLVNNTCSNNTQYGIFIETSDVSTLTNNTCTSNSYGIHLESCSNNVVADNTCSGNSLYGIHLLLSNSNTLVNNTCSNNTQYGIFIETSNLSTLTNNTCAGNIYGVFLINANSNAIINNSYSSNIYGIYINQSSFNILTNNTCSNNQFGIYLLTDTDNNDIQWSVFADNLIINGYDNGTGNIFDYNYWSDYTGSDANLDGFGDTAYVFLANSDPHPLMYLPTPPSWINLPTNLTIEFGQLFRYDFSDISPSPLTFLLNDTLFYVDDQGVVTSRAILFIGTYGLRIVVTNIYGSSLTVTLRIDVLDTTSPDWLIIPTDQTLSYDEAFDYQIAVIDISGIGHWDLSDTVNFTLIIIHYSVGSTARITNLTILAPGVYELNVTVSDQYGNAISANFLVTVKPPETDMITTTTTTSTGQTEVDATLIIVAGLGISGAAAIVIVLIIFKKRRGE